MSGHGSVGGYAEGVRIWLLDGFRVSIGSRTIEGNEWRLKKAASLVKLLALAPSHRLHREQVMDLLWPNLGIRAAPNNLRQALHAARRTLASDPAAGSNYLASEDESLLLCPESPLWVDAEAFEEAARAARRSQDPADYEAALELYTGELLPQDRYEEWAQEPRRRLRETYLSLLLGLAHLHEERVKYDSAIEALGRVVDEEPAREEAHVGLMRLHALKGSKAEALAQYGRLEEVLLKELGSEPAASSRALREEIAAGRFPPSGVSPSRVAPSAPHSPSSSPEETPDAPRHNLPASRSSFVGRERELAQIKRELANTRLLTLTGAGGTGKTRLALEVACDLVDVYPDGVWLVELAPLSEGAVVPQAVVGVLGVSERPGQPLIKTLKDALRTKEMLLVVDNCEHLVEGAAELVDELLESSPSLRVLATSREALCLEGEVRWPVPTLSVPDAHRTISVAELEGTESVRLFAERARNREPAFALRPENAEAVAKICRRLDGIPLAIELAAARVGALSVEQILKRLEDSLKLLTGGTRRHTSRQRTLRGALDWSHQLLTAAEQIVFRRLSVFAGGWTLEAAEVVVSGEGVQSGDVLEVLFGLVEKSLVVGAAYDVTTEAGEVRYRMYKPIRQYAQEKLAESGEAEELRRRHAEYFLDLAEEAEPQVWGPEDMMWLDRLETEHDNLRTAFSWTRERGESELNLRLTGALGSFWEVRGYYDEGRKRLEEALETEGRASAAVRAKALRALGWLAIAQSDLARAEAAAREGIKLSAEVEIEGGLVASFRRVLGAATGSRGDYERSKELLEESLTLSREADDKLEITNSLLSLGTALHFLGDRERSNELYEEGILLAREFGYVSLVARGLFNRGYTLLLEGDYERGAALNEEAAALSRKGGYKGQLEFILDNLGWAALLQGDHERARTSFEESLTLCLELGDKMIASESLEGVACISGAEGQAERAARLFGAAQALREAVGVHQPPEDAALRAPYLRDTRSLLKEEAWEAFFEQGQTMTFEQIVEYALSLEEEPAVAASPAPELPQAEDHSEEEPPAAALTRREREVASLVAQGLTNRQIASELVLSEHTIHHHLTRILKKLDLRSREQIASRLSSDM